MPDTPRLTIVIVGAGLSGLAAAFRFAQLGYNVTVFKRRSNLSETGGAIMVRSNASKIVKEWGLETDLDAISDVSLSGKYRRAEDGEILHERVPARYTGHPDWGTFRDKLLRVFYRRAIKTKAEVKLGVSTDKIWEDESKASVRLGDGRVVEADIVLAADGVLSRLRQSILPEGVNGLPKIGSMTLHQIILDKDELLSNTSTRHFAENNNLTVWWGQGSYAVGRYSTTLGRFGAIFGVPADDEENPRFWEDEGDIEHVREVFSTYERPIQQLLRMAQSCDRWRLTEMPDLSTWSSIHGRLILLGDSAHAMLPDAAQSFSQIIEDIEVLSRLLEQSTDLPKAIAAWEAIRIPRVTKIKGFARSNHQANREGGARTLKQAASSNISEQQKPDTESVLVQPDRDAEFNSPTFNAWVYAYDAAKEVEIVTSGTELKR